jgi:hypothetical protein
MMKFNAIHARINRSTVVYLPHILFSALGALLLAGCANHQAELQAEYSEEALSPKPPVFLSGPAGALLTNMTGFSAVVTIERPNSGDKAKPVSGHLLGMGSHLIYSADKGDKTFIWDVQSHTGYVMSDMMQGYAPVYLSTGVTGVTTVSEVAGPVSDRVNGHPGHEADLSVALDDGTTASFTVWRASDLQDFPVRIATLKTDPPFVINFSEVRTEKLSPALFAPPDGFTRYDSVEAMTGEMVLRRSKLKNSATQKPLPDRPIAPTGPKPGY